MPGLSKHIAKQLLARLEAAHRRLRSLSAQEEKMVQKLALSIEEDQYIWTVPRLHGEVHDIHALKRAGDLLFNN